MQIGVKDYFKDSLHSTPNIITLKNLTITSIFIGIFAIIIALISSHEMSKLEKKLHIQNSESLKFAVEKYMIENNAFPKVGEKKIYFVIDLINKDIINKNLVDPSSNTQPKSTYHPQKTLVIVKNDYIDGKQRVKYYAKLTNGKGDHTYIDESSEMN